ncbi:MAG: triose-phosphate isomerase, partial [Chlamydiae bacterium]|nr:triose-phosphate isomerase [Chlamydiota bacterium]
QVKLFLAVPYLSIRAAADAAKMSALSIGAQNLHEEREGAFTGSVSALMIKEAGATFSLIGHSECRQHFQESDETIRKKVERALQDDLIPVLCIGETLEEREKKETGKVLKRQLHVALSKIPKEEAKKIIIAYEPVWAIGSGKAATPEMAGEAHALIRKELEHLFGKVNADVIPILYGGSVNLENTASLMKQGDIDGLLVGRASLDPNSFAAITNQINKKL